MANEAFDTSSCATDERVVAIVDTDVSWVGTHIRDCGIQIVPPSSHTPSILGSMLPTRTLVNLALPNAFETIAAVRAANPMLPVWGCVSAPGSERVLRLGMIELAPRPFDPVATAAIVRRFGKRGTRVVTAGTEQDTDGFLTLRHALTADGMGVSMAWDALQLADLFAMVRAEIAVVDLDLTPRGAHRVIAGLISRVSASVMVLLPSVEHPNGFAELLDDPAFAAHTEARNEVLTNVLVQAKALPTRRFGR